MKMSIDFPVSCFLRNHDGRLSVEECACLKADGLKGCWKRKLFIIRACDELLCKDCDSGAEDANMVCFDEKNM